MEAGGGRSCVIFQLFGLKKSQQDVTSYKSHAIAMLSQPLNNKQIQLTNGHLAQDRERGSKLLKKRP